MTSIKPLFPSSCFSILRWLSIRVGLSFGTRKSKNESPNKKAFWKPWGARLSRVRSREESKSQARVLEAFGRIMVPDVFQELMTGLQPLFEVLGGILVRMQRHNVIQG